MCHAILHISYQRDLEPRTLKEVTSEEELTKCLQELLLRAEVRKVITFFPYMSRELISEWKTTYYEKTNENSLPSSTTHARAKKVTGGNG